MLDKLGRTARAAGGDHHLRRQRLKLAPRLGAMRVIGQGERIVERHPIPQLADQIAGIFGEEGHRHMLPAARRRDDDERFDPLRAGDDAQRTRGVELGLELGDRRGERGIVDGPAGITAGLGNDRGAVRKLAGDDANGCGETVFRRSVGEIFNGGVCGGCHC